jgi:hypothetical protein
MVQDYQLTGLSIKMCQLFSGRVTLPTQYRVDRNLSAVVQHPNSKTYLNIFSSYELRGIKPQLTQRKTKEEVHSSAL